MQYRFSSLPFSYPIKRSWNSDGTANVASNAQHRRVHAHQRRLAARAASRRQLAVPRVHRGAVDVVGGLEVHAGLGLVGAGKDDGAQLAERLDDGGVVVAGAVDPGDEAGVCQVGGDADLVLEGEGDAVEGTDEAAGEGEVLVAGLGVVDGFGEELGEAVCLW